MRSGGASYLILGALRGDARSGYEIKALVDRAFRFFWAVSYGQIYPELRRLKEEGLIEATGNDDGGRRRVRYELTPAGRKTLVDWLRTPTAGCELRDEGLLKLFFADALEPAEALALVRTLKAERQATLDRLREIEAHAAARSHTGFPAVVLEYGIEYHEWVVGWCSRLEQRLEAAPSETEEVAR